MAYVAPNTTIHLMDMIRLDPRYENTAWFNNRTAQTSYFLSCVRQGMSFSNQSYQRKNRGVIRLQADYGNVIACNYMMFQNSSFENKWFYAFITKVEYISNNVTEITYEIDVIQTYLFDWNINQCFVEREHSATDYIGDNVLPEDVPVTAWTYSDPVKAPPFDETVSTDYLPVAVVASTESADEMTGTTQYDNLRFVGSRVYNGCYLYGFHLPSGGIMPTPNLDTFLRQVVNNNKINGIVAIFMCPGAFAPIYKQGEGGFYLDTSHLVSEPYLWEIPKHQSWTYSYAGKNGPRNKKLYTFQFNKLIITDHDEANAEYPYEYFVGSQYNAQFKIRSSITPNPEFACIPYSFKGSTDSFIHQLISHGYPQCSFATDTFERWLAQNKYRLIFGKATSAVQSAGRAASEIALGGELGAMFGATNVISGVSSILGEMLTVNSMPDQLNGTIGQNVNLESRAIGFYYYYARAIDECCAMADDFFDMYGYKTCLHKVPNIHVRENWTYTKTVGCIITGSVPADDAKKIESIFDAGIRFWTTEANIGDYSLPNNTL